MRKNVFIFGLIFVFLFIVVSGSFAEVCLQKSFLIGEFALGEANWDNFKESQLLKAVEGLPDNASFEVTGYTDHFGAESINIPLAQKRADLVAERLIKLIPKAEVNTKGVIYKPSDEQDIDYRMVRLNVFFEKEEAFSKFEKTLFDINQKIEKLNNSQSIKALESSVLQFNDSLFELGQGIDKKLSENKIFVDNRIDSFEKMFKEFLLAEENALMERRQEEIKESLKETARINDSINEMRKSLFEIRETQDLDGKLSQDGLADFREIISENSKKISSLDAVEKENRIYLNEKAKQWLIIFVSFQVLIIIITAFLLYYARKKKL